MPLELIHEFILYNCTHYIYFTYFIIKVHISGNSDINTIVFFGLIFFYNVFIPFLLYFYYILSFVNVLFGSCVGKVQPDVISKVFLPSLHAAGSCSCWAQPPGRCTPHCCYLGSVGGPPSARGSLLGGNLQTHPSVLTAARGRRFTFKQRVCCFGFLQVLFPDSFCFLLHFTCRRKEKNSPVETVGTFWTLKRSALLLVLIGFSQ